MFKYTLDNKRYHTLNYYYKNKYGCKVFKISLNGGFTCPNIDGTKGYGGCIYCSKTGSGEYGGVLLGSDLLQIISIANFVPVYMYANLCIEDVVEKNKQKKEEPILEIIGEVENSQSRTLSASKDTSNKEVTIKPINQDYTIPEKKGYVKKRERYK